MSTTYKNTDSASRVWPRVAREDGRTLELEPDETVELESKIDDPYLKPIVKKKKPTKTDDQAEATPSATTAGPENTTADNTKEQKA